jgi:hypothetical protein
MKLILEIEPPTHLKNASEEEVLEELKSRIFSKVPSIPVTERAQKSSQLNIMSQEKKLQFNQLYFWEDVLRNLKLSIPGKD